MKFGKAKFYADENIEQFLIDFVRESGYTVESASELGFHPRDDAFHLQEAKRRKRILITRDLDFLDHNRFPFQDLNDTAIIILHSELGTGDLKYGYMLVSLFSEIGDSGNANLHGLKIELQGPSIRFHARVAGKIRSDEVDISSPGYGKDLFQN